MQNTPGTKKRLFYVRFLLIILEFLRKKKVFTFLPGQKFLNSKYSLCFFFWKIIISSGLFFSRCVSLGENMLKHVHKT